MTDPPRIAVPIEDVAPKAEPGPGDHAELARLAKDLRGPWLSRIKQNKAADALESLLAGNAALRAEREHFESEFKRQCGATANVMDRATEAERKLAEADGLLERIANDPTWDGPSSARLYFLSKEAERG